MLEVVILQYSKICRGHTHKSCHPFKPQGTQLTKFDIIYNFKESYFYSQHEGVFKRTVDQKLNHEFVLQKQDNTRQLQSKETRVAPAKKSSLITEEGSLSHESTANTLLDAIP